MFAKLDLPAKWSVLAFCRLRIFGRARFQIPLQFFFFNQSRNCVPKIIFRLRHRRHKLPPARHPYQMLA